MAKCPDCRQEMLDKEVKTCTYQEVKIDGFWYPRNTDYYDVNDRCHDCSIKNTLGNVHHFGCDIERCPKCSKQLISCDCTKKAVRSTSEVS